jgi:hypothetical protein
MNYEIRPWGPASILLWFCPKCRTPMHDDHDRRSGIRAYACFKCGSRVYPDYPKRPGSMDIACKEVENLAA